MARICRCCLGWRGESDAEGESVLHSPNRTFTLCEPCWLEEQLLYVLSGTNDHPEIVALYAAGAAALATIRAAIAKAEGR